MHAYAHGSGDDEQEIIISVYLDACRINYARHSRYGCFISEKYHLIKSPPRARKCDKLDLLRCPTACTTTLQQHTRSRDHHQSCTIHPSMFNHTQHLLLNSSARERASSLLVFLDQTWDVQMRFYLSTYMYA